VGFGCDVGNAFGIELDRADKIDSMKKKVHVEFGIRTEQSSLVFGDQVLDKDLNEIIIYLGSISFMDLMIWLMRRSIT
jgi:hypothetical protein